LLGIVRTFIQWYVPEIILWFVFASFQLHFPASHLLAEFKGSTNRDEVEGECFLRRWSLIY
jgi:hypothetical protein